MKNTIKLFAILFSLLTLQSCIQEEPLNAECDITGVTVSGNILNRAPVISNNKVTLTVKNGVAVNMLAPMFELTPGATIQPKSGTIRDFSTPQEYTVTSQDGKWHKTYTVEVQHTGTLNLEYNFEHVRQVSALMGSCSYDVFYEVGPDGNESLTWASANAAFALTLQGTDPESFPTYQADNGKSGKCVALTTRSTGSFGASMNKPIAAGSLFLGEFAMSNALSKPLEATHFGISFSSVPTSLSGVYKYFPGEEYCSLDASGNLVPVPGEVDKFNIYAVFFEVTPGMEWLDGTNVLAADNDNIIATAEIPSADPASEWKEFNIPFIYRKGKSIDQDKLEAGKYSIAVVMSSSRDGDYFSGAVGSTLYVDELILNCQQATNSLNQF